MIAFTPVNIKTWSRIGSNGAFGIAAAELAETDKSVVMLTSDLMFYSGLNRFQAAYPDRLYNLGIAEQNLIGVAAGMAKEGLTPFANTYASFAASRCVDQVRVNMGYMQLGIKLVGLTSGLSVGILGATHMSIEDIAVMRSIPNLTVLSPADCAETIKATLAAAKIKGPVYLRLTGSMGNPIVYDQDFEYVIGKANTLKEGSDLSIIATGSMVYTSLQAAKLLEAQGISCQVLDMHTIKPLDIEAVKNACKTKLIVTVEEHSDIGGLGSAVAETLSILAKKPPQLIIGLADEYKHAGTYDFLLSEYGLTAEKIADRILTQYKGVNIHE
jgi:transketolase